MIIVLYTSDIKRLEDITDNEKEILFKKFRHTDMDSMKFLLDGTIYLSPSCLCVLAMNKRHGPSLVYNKWNLAIPGYEGYLCIKDYDLIDMTRSLSQCIDNIHMKMMTK